MQSSGQPGRLANLYGPEQMENTTKVVTSKGLNQVNKVRSAEQANEWEQTDKQVARNFHLDSYLSWTIVHSTKHVFIIPVHC